LGFRVEGLGLVFRVWASEFGVKSSQRRGLKMKRGTRVQGSGGREEKVEDSGLKI
jgi:hypothetical protein